MHDYISPTVHIWSLFKAALIKVKSDLYRQLKNQCNCIYVREIEILSVLKGFELIIIEGPPCSPKNSYEKITDNTNLYY